MIENAEKFYDENGQLMATVVRSSAVGSNRSQFFSDPEHLLQVGLLNLKTGEIIQPHVHCPIDRKTRGTAEVLFVLRGWIRVYLHCPWEIQTLELTKNEFVILQPGSRHAVEVTDDALVFECKSGPYLGREIDKGLKEVHDECQGTTTSQDEQQQQEKS